MGGEWSLQLSVPEGGADVTVELNHTIVHARDKRESATFLTEMLGLAAPRPFGHFLVLQIDNGVSLDFMDDSGPISTQHYAFLVSEPEFDTILGRIRARGLPHWASMLA
jgi:hypothetical protein